ncbi:class I SAM-dependent methyltransferase [Burkholderia multivorans]|uniref:class I SAM-dependent methyltransferase n=1 Tax=Burkholderia multivorans TaxID=87883 RepID=UPI0012D30816|nr:methyltransferase domain-containing protein [Burkholderia multivorans]
METAPLRLRKRRSRRSASALPNARRRHAACSPSNRRDNTMTVRLRQPGLPRGLIGQILGRIMRRHNRPDNAWTLSLLAIRDGEQALEVGFGPGDAIRLALESTPSCSIAGIDHSPTMLNAAKRLNRASIERGRVRLALGSVDALPFADDAFDKAFSINCIYFWRAPARGLAELHRVVRPGGIVAITVRDYERAPYDAFRPEKLSRLMIDAGFASVAVHRNGVPSHPLVCVLGAK